MWFSKVRAPEAPGLNYARREPDAYLIAASGARRAPVERLNARRVLGGRPEPTSGARGSLPSGPEPLEPVFDLPTIIIITRKDLLVNFYSTLLYF